MSLGASAVLVLLACAASLGVVALFALVAETLGRPAGLLVVGSFVVLFGAGFTSCSNPTPPPPVNPTPVDPPQPAQDCVAACSHLAMIGCGSDTCKSVCSSVQLPGYVDCLLQVQPLPDQDETCRQADACDTGR